MFDPDRRQTWNGAASVLCVRLDSIGDLLMTTPAIRALKNGGPKGRKITLLTSPAGAKAGMLVPEIDDVIVFEAPWMKATPSHSGSVKEREMVERLRSEAFDAAAIFTVYSQNPLPSAFLCYLADIPLRLAHCRDNPYQLLTDWVPDPEPEQGIRHEVRRHLDLVQAVGCSAANERLSLRIPKRSYQQAMCLLGGLRLAPERPWVVIHPGATAPSRRYPWESFAEVADRLNGELGCDILFTGAEAERDLVEMIRGAMKATPHFLVGRMDLGGLAAVLSFAQVLVSNNTGPVHIAAAVGTPVVVLYALTNPQHRPWGVPQRVLSHDVPCKYCYKSVCPEGHQGCLSRIKPGAVVEAARHLLNETASRRPVLECQR